jgi:hypothetical protein
MAKFPERFSDLAYRFLYYFAQLKDVEGFRERLLSALSNGQQRGVFKELEAMHEIVKVDSFERVSGEVIFDDIHNPDRKTEE